MKHAERIIDKMMDYLSGKMYLEEYDDIKKELLTILQNEESKATFSLDQIKKVFMYSSELEKELTDFLIHIMQKKNATVHVRAYDVFNSFNHFLERDTEFHVNVVLDLNVEGTKPVVVVLPNHFVHKLIDIETGRESENEPWRQADRMFTEEEMEYAKDHFLHYYLKPFQRFFKGIDENISLSVKDVTQDDEELESYLPSGEILCMYVNNHFQQGTSTVGETIHVLIPYKSMNT